jgi:signal transduction histidine kinase
VVVVLVSYISVGALHDKQVASESNAFMGVLEHQDKMGIALTAEVSDALLVAAAQQSGQPEALVAAAEQQLMAARAETDAQLTGLLNAYRGLELSALDPAVQAAVDRGMSAPEVLTGIREQADNGGDARAAIEAYSELLSLGMSVPQSFVDSASDRELARYLSAYILTDELIIQMDLEKTVGSLALQASQADVLDDESTLFASQLFSRGFTIEAQAVAAVEDLGIGTGLSPANDAYTRIRTTIAAGAPGAVSASDAQQWSQLSDEAYQKTITVRDELRNATADKAAQEASSAGRTAWITIGAGILAVLVSIGVAWAVAGTIGRPLRRLTAAAQEVRDELPGIVEEVVLPGDRPSSVFVPLEVEGRDEIGQLAAAFNDVNATTIAVAREQAALRGSIAEMFVNVARRDQVLLNRQLAFLDDLERAEQDPGTLSNLFRLDHLATRMRRNAESLLVLAGIDSGRRVRQPMALSDVIRTASSEIELFDRVRLNLDIDPLILGHNALNAAHLIAELLENATMFSEPHTPVEVYSGYDGQFVRVSVHDHGLGMTPEEIEEANRRVATLSATDVVGAQRLGLYVVGRLADRLGARITFTADHDGAGTEAVVDLPISLFAADSNTNLSPAAEKFDRSSPREIAPASFAPEPAPVVDAEPPMAVPVDIDALTDGTTTSGMPRRRSRSVEHMAAPPSATVSQMPQTGSIVLPPLVTPDVPLDLPQGEDSWVPPEDVTMPGGALPSRHRPSSAAESATPAEPLLPGAPADELPAEDGPALDVDARTALFSRFRTMGELDTSIVAPDSTMELAPAPEMSATDISVAEVDQTSGEEWTPTFALEGDASLVARPHADEAVPPAPVVPEMHQRAVEPSPAPEEPYQPVFVPEASSDEMPIAAPTEVREDNWLSALTDETVALRPRDLNRAKVDPFDSSAPEIAPAPAFDVQPTSDLPVGAAFEAAPPVFPGDGHAVGTPASESAGTMPTAEEIPEYLRVEALPRFEELMSDLPTRRSVRDGSGPRRGLFGRRPRVASAGSDESTFVNEQAPAAASPVERAYAEPSSFAPPADRYSQQAEGAPGSLVGPPPSIPIPVEESSGVGSADGVEPAGLVPSAPKLVDPEPYFVKPFSVEAPSTDRFAPQYETPEPVEPFRPEAWEPPTFAPEPALAPSDLAYAPLETNPVPVVRQSDVEDARTASLPMFAGTPTNTSAHDLGSRESLPSVSAVGSEGQDASGYGPPAPLTRRHAKSQTESGRSYGDDSVEARSEWTASAVLYEEMNSLLRSTGDMALEAPVSDTYQPLRMDTDGPNLSRRPMENREGYVDRFTARIDRDPEQLRARLAAFQSATARGRAEAQEETDTGAVPGSVPDQAPQSR